MKRLDIRLAAQYSGIKAHTIRIWEQRYGLLNPQKGAGNRRLYSKEDIVSLIDIALLTKYGYAISRLVKFSPQKIGEIITQMSSSAAGPDISINNLLKFYLDTDIYNFDRTLNDFVSRKGIHVAIREVIFPFIERAELFGYDDQSPASHVAVNILKNKIIAGTDQLNRGDTVEQNVVLFLPQGQHFDLVLQNINYHLLTAGFGVFYMGANAPLESVSEIASKYQADLCVTYVAPAGKGNINDLRRLAREHLSGELFIAGAIDNKQRLVPYNKLVAEIKQSVQVNG